MKKIFNSNNMSIEIKFRETEKTLRKKLGQGTTFVAAHLMICGFFVTFSFGMLLLSILELSNNTDRLLDILVFSVLFIAYVILIRFGIKNLRDLCVEKYMKGIEDISSKIVENFSKEENENKGRKK